MSVFKNLQNTLQSVQHDLSASVLSKDVQREKKNKSVGRSRCPVNLDAGSELLNSYQNNWKELHNQAEENSRKAEDLAVVLGSFLVEKGRELESLSRLTSMAKELPSVIQHLQDLTNQLAGIDEMCEQIEAEEIQLVNICEIEESRQARSKHHHQLASYTQGKQHALEKYKADLAEQHARKMKILNQTQETYLKERQSIFQEAFDKDVDYYRTFGRPERQPSIEIEDQPVNLADIQIDEDTNALDNFLETEDVSSVPAEEENGDEEDSGVVDYVDSPEHVTTLDDQSGS